MSFHSWISRSALAQLDNYRSGCGDVPACGSAKPLPPIRGDRGRPTKCGGWGLLEWVR